MTKEEAIKYLQQLYPNGGHCWLDEQRIEAIGMAVKALQKEPVSENLFEASTEYATTGEILANGKEMIDFQKQKAFIAGAKWQKEYLWKSAYGDDLPEYEREVIVFTQNFPDDAGIMKVAIAHRPDPKGWDGKSITTGKVEHYTPKTYGNGGWNIPDVIFWLDCAMPKEIEL